MLGEAQLSEALRLATHRDAQKVARRFGMDAERARVLPAGVLILRLLVRRLGVPLEIARGGLREGAASQLLAELRAA
jgi:exopolyphosphatase/pppGpp-phosphohydrolase